MILNRNYFQSSLNIMIYKMTLLPLPKFQIVTSLIYVLFYERTFFYHIYLYDCIGAIDSTNVRVSLLVDEQIPYIGRKGYSTQNIMAACGFDMLFTFIWLGWKELWTILTYF